MNYIGRFAPTPSGPLHFGSICTALGSFLDARSHGGLWLLRIDDLDQARVKAGVADRIFSMLEQLGLNWDHEAIYQSRRIEEYSTALEKLDELGLTYPCTCTRAMVKGKPYPGTCRDNPSNPVLSQHAKRLRVSNGNVELLDRLRGPLGRNILESSGDFIVRRADNLIAYHLASVIDDAGYGVTDVVRGADLIDASLCQVFLQNCLDVSLPTYCHLPLAIRRNGSKISKSTEAEDRLAMSAPLTVLLEALRFLGQVGDDVPTTGDVRELIDWAVKNWDLSRVPQRDTITIPG